MTESTQPQTSGIRRPRHSAAHGREVPRALWVRLFIYIAVGHLSRPSSAELGGQNQ